MSNVKGLKFADPKTVDYGEEGFWHQCEDRGRMMSYLALEDIHGIGDFYSVTEQFIRDKEQEEIEHVKRTQKDPDWSEDYPWRWQDIIGTQLRTSFVLTLMSSIEWHLRGVCEHVQMVTKSKKSTNDFEKKRDLYQRSREFLKVVGKFSVDNENWCIAEEMYKLRNVLAHNGGYLDTEATTPREKETVEKVRNLIARFPGLRENCTHLDVEKEFCEFILKWALDFIKTVFAEYQNLCERILATRPTGA